MSVKLGLIIETIKTICGEYRYWACENAFDFVHTFEHRLDIRKRKVFEHPRYKKLPRWAVSEIAGAMKVLDGQFEDKLFWTHVIDGVRVFYRDPRVEGRHIEISQQEPTLSCFCYVVQVTNPVGCWDVFVPYREADRQADLATNRLHQNQIDMIVEPYRNDAKVKHWVKDRNRIPHRQLMFVDHQ